MQTTHARYVRSISREKWQQQYLTMKTWEKTHGSSPIHRTFKRCKCIKGGPDPERVRRRSQMSANICFISSVVMFVLIFANVVALTPCRVLLRRLHFPATLPRHEMKICSLSSTHHGPGREVSSCQQPTPPHHTRRLSCLRSQRKNGCLASTDTNTPAIINLYRTSHSEKCSHVNSY